MAETSSTTATPAPGDGKTYRLADGVGNAAARARRYVVTGRVNRSHRVVIRPVDKPEDRGARVDPQYLIEVDESAPVAVGVPYQTPYGLGTIVRFAREPGALFVVLWQTDVNVYRIARLGGTDGNRYFTKVAHASLTGVPMAEVIK
jgi:hypothetical protein